MSCSCYYTVVYQVVHVLHFIVVFRLLSLISCRRFSGHSCFSVHYRFQVVVFTFQSL